MQEPNKIIKWSLYQFDFQNKNIPSEIEEWEDEEVEEGEGFEDDPTANMPVILNTPFGFCRVDDSMNPFKRFDFWMGHTTFDITPEVRDSLKVAYGVEVLHLITRYRFIIAIGKAFNFRDVRVNIEKELCGMHKVSSLIDDINRDICLYRPKRMSLLTILALSLQRSKLQVFDHTNKLQVSLKEGVTCHW